MPRSNEEDHFERQCVGAVCVKTFECKRRMQLHDNQKESTWPDDEDVK